ncbi:hypothetical protein [Shewanella sp. UCD-KL12]|uniref:hypothetical protein n=1 Tax=Shewanella sp. UCD-KL12 TaxID=1917163 RepID=UPI0009709061|nr:hypothetical protein [Shewanella sp. UCD-KL12]
MLRFILSAIIIYAFWLTYQDASAYFDGESVSDSQLELAQSPVANTELVISNSLLNEASKYRVVEELSCEETASCKSE